MEIYRDKFKALASPCLVLEHSEGHFLIREANTWYINTFAKKHQQLIGLSMLEVLQENPELHGTSWEVIYNSLNEALLNGTPNNIEALRYDILSFETDEFEEAYWQIENIPVIDETTGKIAFLLFVARDKTLEILEKKNIC